MAYELIIYCDESIQRGRFFSNFYGGVLVSSLNQEIVNKVLNEKKKVLNLNNEIKWQRVTGNYLAKYIELIDCFFDFVKAKSLKLESCLRKMLMCRQGWRNTIERMHIFYYTISLSSMPLE